MSNRDPRQRFDYQNWLNSQVAERAKASLTARDAAFAENNAGVTRAALTQYLNVCAAALGHSPSPTEIDGGAFIEQRFGSWDNAMTAAGLPRPKTTPKLNNTLRYRMEKEKLLPLYFACGTADAHYPRVYLPFKAYAEKEQPPISFRETEGTIMNGAIGIWKFGALTFFGL